MFWTMVKGMLFRQWRNMLMIAFTVALGVSLATAMINVMLGVGDKVNRELKTYGANINVVPKEASLLNDLYGAPDVESASTSYLKEDELPNVKTIFWGFNIVDYAPYFNTTVHYKSSKNPIRLVGTWFAKHMDLETGESLNTGIKPLKAWWEVQGRWPLDSETDTIMVGSLLAERLGIHVLDTIALTTSFAPKKTRDFTVVGIFTSGDVEDSYLYTSLLAAQELSGIYNSISSIEVSALTTPDNDLARKAARNPKSLTLKEWETWYCTAYASAICYQLQEVITDSIAKPIRQVAESEGAILNKTSLLMTLITILSMLGSALGISNLVTASVIERSAEIGLLKAIGATNGAVVFVILTEIMITGLLGGLFGYLIGLGFTAAIGLTVFGSTIPIALMTIPIVSVMVFVVILLGSIPSVRYLLSLRPSHVLHGR